MFPAGHSPGGRRLESAHPAVRQEVTSNRGSLSLAQGLRLPVTGEQEAEFATSPGLSIVASVNGAGGERTKDVESTGCGPLA